MKISRSEQARELKLETLAPGNNWTIPPAIVGNIGIPIIRERCSRINREFKANMRVHKNNDGSVCVWHDPAPAPAKFKGSKAFEELADTTKRRNWLALQIRNELDNAKKMELLDELGKLDDKISECLYQLKEAKLKKEAKKSKGGRIQQSLETVLKHIGVTEEIWNLLPKYEQTRRWIAAEVEIRDAQRQQGAGQ